MYLAKLVAEKSPSAVLIPSSADGKEIAGRLAVAIDSGVITDAVAVSSDVVATQNVFGGATIVHSRVSKGTPVITVRTNSIAPVQSGGSATRVDVAAEVSSCGWRNQSSKSSLSSKEWPPRSIGSRNCGFRWTWCW
jgi:electron transfer flavoprotein alpha subunit